MFLRKLLQCKAVESIDPADIVLHVDCNLLECLTVHLPHLEDPDIPVVGKLVNLSDYLMS